MINFIFKEDASLTKEFDKSLTFVVFAIGALLSVLWDIIFSISKAYYFGKKSVSTQDEPTKLKPKNKIKNKDFSINFNKSLGFDLSFNFNNLSKVEIVIPEYSDDKSVITNIEQDKEFSQKEYWFLFGDILYKDLVYSLMIIIWSNSLNQFFLNYISILSISLLSKIGLLFKHTEKDNLEKDIYISFYSHSFMIFPIILVLNLIKEYYLPESRFILLKFLVMGIFFKMIFFDQFHKELSLKNNLYRKIIQSIIGTSVGIATSFYFFN